MFFKFQLFFFFCFISLITIGQDALNTDSVTVPYSEFNAEGDLVKESTITIPKTFLKFKKSQKKGERRLSRSEGSNVLFKDDTINQGIGGSFTLFDSSIKFFDVTSNAFIRLVNCDINGDFELLYSDFFEFVNFGGNHYYSFVRFKNCDFDSSVSFYSSKFLLDFDVDECNFFESLFNKSEFTGNVNIVNSNFVLSPSFDQAKFIEDVKIEECTFSSSLNLSNTSFKENLSLKGSFVESVLSLNFITVKAVEFQKFNLPHIIDFTKASIENPVDLNNTVKRNSMDFCYLKLIDAPLDKINFKYDNFRVFIPDTINANNFNKLISVYQQLIERYSLKGDVVSKELVHKEYINFKNTRNPNQSFISKKLSQIMSFFSWVWNDYGYSKGRIWFWTFILFVIFSALNRKFYPTFLSEAYPVGGIDKVYNLSLKQNEEGAYIKPGFLNGKVLVLSLFYTGLVFFGLKLHIDKMNFKYPWTLLFIFFQYTVGLISLAYLANFIITN